MIKKNDSIKNGLYARHLNSKTDQSSESWPMEPLETQLANKKHKSAIDPMYAYAHATLYDEPIKLTGFSAGDELLAFIRGFHGHKSRKKFSHNKYLSSSKI